MRWLGFAGGSLFVLGLLYFCFRSTGDSRNLQFYVDSVCCVKASSVGTVFRHGDDFYFTVKEDGVVSVLQHVDGRSVLLVVNGVEVWCGVELLARAPFNAFCIKSKEPEVTESLLVKAGLVVSLDPRS